MTQLTPEQLDLIRTGHAAMITVGSDGYAKPVRVGLGIVDGVLCSTGTATRRRTARLRSDPRCTLYVADAAYRYLALETTVTILDGDAGVEGTMRLVRQMQGVADDSPVTWFGETLDPEAFRQRMIDEQRILYQFEVHRAYGLLGMP
jgi:hypothetical protein